MQNPPLRFVVEGPYFAYHDSPSLFLGREGYGPLEVVWDTNVLLDYLKYGPAMWEGDLLDVRDEAYAAELEALNLIINTWVRRDIRFHVLDRSITDAKRQLTEERRHARAQAVGQISAALRLDPWSDTGDCLEGTRTDRHEQAALFVASDVFRRLPTGEDRELVRESVARGAHVFLTRDHKVLKHREALIPHKLLLASPLDLVEEFSACGAILATLQPETVYWPLPDLQRMSHLIQALG